MGEQKYKEPTCAMKTALLDLLHVVMVYDDGKPGLPHEVRGVHHATLKAMAKKDYGCLIILDVSTCPTGLVWSVIMTRQGLKVAKRLVKEPNCNNDTDINSDKNKKRKVRSLRTVQWQVDVNQETGAKIYKDVRAMKEDRSQSFTKTMNTLMELHGELKEGQVALLQKLYPEAYAAMLLIAQTEIEMEREDKLGELIGEWKRLMLSQGANMPTVSDLPQDNGSTQASGGLKAIGGHKTFTAPPPIDDEDDEDLGLEIVKSKDAGMNATMNFLKSMQALADAKPTGESTLTPRQKARLEKDARNE